MSMEAVVRVTRNGQHLVIRPPCPEVFADLCTVRHDVVQDRARGLATVAIAEPLVEQHGDWAQCDLGLYPEVVRRLEQSGHRVVNHVPEELAGYPRPLPEPAIDRLAGRFPDADTPFLHFVQQQPRGVVQYNGQHVDPANLLIQLGLAFPAASVAVLGASTDQLTPLATRMRPFFRDLTVVNSRCRPETAGRIVLATPRGMTKDAVEIEKRDVVVVLDAVAALGVRSRFALQHAQRARLFALSTRDRLSAPRDAVELISLFGLSRLCIPRHGCQELPVHVVRLRFGCGSLSAQDSAFMLKRAGLWRHPIRNRTVARIATAIANGNPDSLRRGCRRLAELIQDGVGRRTVILVENLLHGLELANRLSDWPIIAAANAGLGLSAAEQSRLYAGGDWQDHFNRAIVTAAGAEQLDLNRVDVLLRADGGTGLPPIPSEKFVIDNKLPHRLVLVDFDDRHDGQLRRSSNQRMATYRTAGWRTAEVEG